jgi:catechol 2,3-dioxygenase-like lactoylglutathione lyase family enzyme
MIGGIGHINIVVIDLQAAANFFVKNFGFTAGQPKKLTGAWVDQLTGYTNAVAVYIPMIPPQGPTGTAFELLTYLNPSSPPPAPPPPLNVQGFRHVGFNVADIDGMVAQLKAQGIQFFSDVVTVTEMNLKTVYFYGPENIILQLTQSLAPGGSGEA